MTNITSEGIAPASTIDKYHEDGFAVFRSIFNHDEITALAIEADHLYQRTELIDADNLRCRWQTRVDTNECIFDCFDPVIDIAPVAKYFAYSDRLLGILKALHHVDYCLFKDKLIFKHPQVTGYALHQDFIGWDTFPESFLTVIVAIDATVASNGATEVFPGFHQQGYLSPRDGEYHELPASMVDDSAGVMLELQPGDIAIFSGFTPHRSATNLSDRPRRQLYLSYNAANDGGDQRENHYAEFHVWLKKKYAEYGKTNVYFR